MLLEPLRIGPVELRNRVVMAPMTTRLGTAYGYVTEELIAYYEARARGGVGLVTIELASPHPSGAHRRGELGIYDDRYLDGLSRLVERVHAHGARISLQVGHAGAHARPDVTGWPAVAPSSVPHVVQEGDVQVVRPRPLSKGQIAEIVGWYGDAASRLARAGFDMVEIQGGHDYLVFQFLSPLDNQRTDEYGGELAGRARFAMEVVAAVRASAPRLPVSFRYSADEFAPGGFSRQDGLELAGMLAKAGVNMVSVSAGSARSGPIPWLITTPMAYPAGLFVPLAADIKRTVPVPVAVVGRLHDPDLAESVLREGSADLIVLGRALIADPDWVAKVAVGAALDIRPCIACNTCVDHLRSGERVACLVNPEAMGEYDAGAHDAALSGQMTAPKRRVVVVGAGPAGLTAAAGLARAGCDVVVLDERPNPGGRLHDAPRAPYFQVVETDPEPFRRLISYLIARASEAGVVIRSGVRATSDTVLAEHPDQVVIAVGAQYPVQGMLNLLRLAPVRRIARHPMLRKQFFKLLRARPDIFTAPLTAAGVSVRVVGDASGSRGVEAAIRSGARVSRTEHPALCDETPQTVNGSPRGGEPAQSFCGAAVSPWRSKRLTRPLEMAAGRGQAGSSQGLNTDVVASSAAIRSAGTVPAEDLARTPVQLGLHEGEVGGVDA